MINAEQDIEKAYQILEAHGVPRERAKSVHNGIDVLMSRIQRKEADTIANFASLLSWAREAREAFTRLKNMNEDDDAEVTELEGKK